MKNFIDLMGNITYTSKQIEKRLTSMERQRYPVRAEAILNRIGSGVALDKRPNVPAEDAALNAFGSFMTDLETLGDEIRSDNQLLKDTLRHEAAQDRLTCYILSEGRPSQGAVEAVYDEDSGVLISEAVPYIAGIDALEDPVVGISGYDENGEPTLGMIANPLIIQDVLEREQAQALIDGASQEVLDLIILRGN